MIAILLLVTLAQAAGAPAPAATTLDAAAIREAITLGQTKESLGFRLQAKGFTIGHLWTPFARVANAARDAQKTYRPFTEKDVTPEMTASELHVTTNPIVIQPTKTTAGSIASVRAVVIMPKGSKDLAAAIQPIRTNETRSVWTDSWGFEYEGRGIEAVFPMEALREGHEVRVVYDKRIGVIVAGCTECNAEIKMAKIR